MLLSDKLLKAGVVGAGGAGFPTHVKADSTVEFVLANGAECEPLIHKDVELMKKYPNEIVEGMKMMLQVTNAKKGYFGIKSKNTEAVEVISDQLNGTNISFTFLGDFYPSGDEYELVYEATKKLIPPGGIPLDIGCVVNNVESLFNIYKATNDIPVTDKFLTIAGEINNPMTFWAPIGTSFRDLIEHAGGSTIDEYAIFVGGLMMGELTFDTERVVTKTTAGIILLPKDHYMVSRMDRSPADMNRIGKSACDQCNYCTELCPRYLLGYDVQPHKVMRTLEFTTTGKEVWNQFADLCCECGICSLYACPEDLYPREACQQSKVEMRSNNIKFEQVKPLKVHPIKEGRKIPLKQLRKKLNVDQYDTPTPFMESSPQPEIVKILLKQHVGKSAVQKVSVGDKVKKGDTIGEISEGDLGVNVHSSIDGTVTFANSDYIEIKR